MNKLSADTIRLLSSSQVITSVSSTVKELVENALDAGATNLDVKLEKWGLDKIEVRDNGCGIKESETSVMAQRHYTSKIAKHEDLTTLDTYGFRGEALGSLCQVADVCITTKTVGDAVAMCYTLDHGGKISSKKPTHGSNGTTVVACSLFKNLPVRKQFYGNAKKCKEELKKIEDLLMAYGLINPEVRVALRNNKTLVWQKNKSCDIKTAMMDIFGVHVFNQLEYFEHVADDLLVSIKGFLPKSDSDPQLTSRSSEDRCFLFINKRFVVWKELIQVLKKQCIWRSLESDSGKFPLCFISLHLSSQDIDANLEPNKTKVLIKPKEEVLEIISRKLRLLYEVDSGHLSLESAEELIEANAAELPGVSVNDHFTQKGQNRASTKENISEISTKTNTNYFMDGLSNHEPENQRDVLPEKGSGTSKENDVVHQNDCNRLDGQSTSWPDDYGELNTACFSDHNGFNINNVDNTSHQNDVSKNSANNTCVLTRQIDSNGENDDGGSHRNGKKDCDSVGLVDKTPMSPGRKEQSNLDDLLGDLVDELDVIDNVTFASGSAQPSLELWSKGQSLCDKNGKEIEPTKLLVPCVPATGSGKKTSMSTLNGKRKHSSDKDSPSPKLSVASKRIKKIIKVNGQPLLTSVLQSPKTTTTTRTRTATKQVLFSLSSLKQLASNKRQSVPTSDDIKLIKRLDPWGVWLISKKRHLAILNPYRIQEILLYKRLLATHVVPKEKLGKAIILDERILGDASRYCMLEKLIKSKKDSENIQFCEDERIIFNGFEICRRTDAESGKTRIELTKMNTTIPYFGVRDLIEVLDLIKGKENVSPPVETNLNRLASSRPSKVCSFLKGEVVRISRGLSSRMGETDITVILENMKNELTGDENTCIHNQPFLYTLTSY